MSMRNSVLFLLLAAGTASAALILTPDNFWGFQTNGILYCPLLDAVFLPNFSSDIPLIPIPIGEFSLPPGYFLVVEGLTGSPWGPPDIETLLGWNQPVYVLTPEEWELLMIPEPASGLLLAAGVLCLFRGRKR